MSTVELVTTDTKAKDKVFSYQKMEYDLIRMKPDSRMGSTFYDEMINVVYSTYKPLKERFSQEKFSKTNSDVTVEVVNPITYEVVFSGSDRSSPYFYFGVPKNKSGYIKQRLQGVFPNSTLTFIDSFDSDFQNCYIAEYSYAKDNMLSLKIKDNNFLQMMLNLKADLQPNEKILFQVEMTPLSNVWKAFNDEKWDKLRAGKDVVNKTSLFNKGLDIANEAVNSVFAFADELMEYKGNNAGDTIKREKNVASVSTFSSASKSKRNGDGFAVTIKAFISTDMKEKAISHATTIETCLRELEEDNRLVLNGKLKTGSIKRGKSIKDMISIWGKNIMSGKEVASIVNLPNQRLQREFKIDSVNVKQINAPKQMTKGKIMLGHLTKHGETVGVFLSEDRDLTCLPLFLLTKMGGGKTTFLLNFCNDAIKAKHGLVLFDYIKNCATAKALIEMYPNCKIIQFEKWEDLCTFAFPEVEMLDSDTPYERRTKANTLSKEVKYLLNAMAYDTEDMSRIMSEYLTSACKIVFVHNKKTLNDVYLVLTDEETRHFFIDLSIEQGIFTEKSFEVKKLLELDEKPQNANGVLDRFSVINEDTLFQEMLMKPYESNVNFVDIMNNGEPVVIMMPQHIFTSKIHKDAICTYFMSRIRLAMSRRTNFDSISHIIVDELHQIPHTMEIIADTIAEPRKFSMQYVMSLHAMSQIEKKEIREKIMGVGCNFMLLKGISHQAFEEFKTMLNGEFDYDDIINMDYKFGSLNMFMVDNAYSMFMTEMPPALRDQNGKLYIS